MVSDVIWKAILPRIHILSSRTAQQKKSRRRSWIRPMPSTTSTKISLPHQAIRFIRSIRWLPLCSMRAALRMRKYSRILPRYSTTVSMQICRCSHRSRSAMLLTMTSRLTTGSPVRSTVILIHHTIPISMMACLPGQLKMPVQQHWKRS